MFPHHENSVVSTSLTRTIMGQPISQYVCSDIMKTMYNIMSTCLLMAILQLYWPTWPCKQPLHSCNNILQRPVFVYDKYLFTLTIYSIFRVMLIFQTISSSSSNLGTGFTRKCIRFRENFAQCRATQQPSTEYLQVKLYTGGSWSSCCQDVPWGRSWIPLLRWPELY